MKYAFENTALTLKRARRAKGVSQRLLSEQTGITQANISKIENGGVDIKISTLIELARALDLEVTLVPRRAMPAVQNLARITKPRRGQKEIHRIIASIKTVGTLLSHHWPDDHGLRHIRELAPHIGKFQPQPEEVEELASIKEQLNQILRSSKSERNGDAKSEKATRKKFSALAKQTRRLRNGISHRMSSTPQEAPRPAYILDEDNDHG